MGPLLLQLRRFRAFQFAKCKQFGCAAWQEYRPEVGVRGTPILVARPLQNRRFLLGLPLQILL